ncbi:MAG: ABC transporter ATP-binding protein/permease, partial [Clostridia bacterium]|nr:ABC transporter ATP-binding protein/permease [Clostridia bacterium]
MKDEMTEKEKKEFKPLPHFGLDRLLPYVKPYTKTLVMMVSLAMVGTGIDIILPLFQKYAIANYITDSHLRGLWLFVALYAVVLCVQVASNFFSTYAASKVEMYVGRDMKRASFNHLQTLSFSYYNQNSVGYIHARVMSDTGRIAALVSWSLIDSIWNLTYLIGATVVMIAVDWRLALCVLVIVPFVAVLSVFFQKKLIFLNRRVREANSRITSGYNEGITGAKTSKTLVIEDKMDRSFEELTGNMHRVATHTEHYRAMFISVVAFASSVALAAVLWRGGYMTESGIIELATLSLFMSYATSMMEPIQWAVRAFSDLIAVQVNVERFTKLMETESDVADTPEVIEKYGDSFAPKKENWEPLYGDVEFDDITFRYPDGEENVLEHFSLKLPQGQTVAIVGETGAGKSTLVNLVCRFFEPTEGRILIDGRDVRERSQLWLHSNIGYVLQTPHLFSGSVIDNLRYGKPDATMEEIEAAVRAVHAEDIIAKMENGYDSDVGEGGDLLSTGEKQLLSFARAILADPRIFVLDEATSSVDTVTEKLIQNAIDKLMENRTCFIIAHRLSTIRKADVILVVSDGKIIERGT